MYLFIDAGNTRIKCAGWDGVSSDWLFDAAVPTARAERLDLPAGFAPNRILAVSVAGAAVNTRVEHALRDRGVAVEWFRSSAEAGGLRNRYSDATQLGADRWAAAIGAWQRVQAACIVVGAGTATTIDLISDEAVFEGGCILPGLDMMRRSLAAGTAGLPLAPGRFEALPRNTADAIFAGCLNAQVGAIERMRAQLPDNAPVILAGGAGDALLPLLGGNVQRVPLLVLEGLRRAVTL